MQQEKHQLCIFLKKVNRVIYELAGPAVINDSQCAKIEQGSFEKILGKEGNYNFEK